MEDLPGLICGGRGNTSIRLKDKTALVTGAGQGIGRAIAPVFAREDAQVALASRTERELQELRKEIEVAGGHALVITADVTDAAQVQWMVD